MDWKKFLRPTVGKVVFIVIVFIVLEIFSSKLDSIYDVGFPLIYRKGGCGQPTFINGELLADTCGRDFYPTNFTIDIAFWYIIAAIGGFIAEKSQPPKQT